MILADPLAVQPANDSPYWPTCVHDPDFLPWFYRFMAIVRNTPPEASTQTLVRMAQKHCPAHPDWGLAVLFLMEHVHNS